MAKKKRIGDRPEKAESGPFDRLANMTLKDLKKECIQKGLDFKSVRELEIYKLQTWLVQNDERTKNPNLLVEFDAWDEARKISEEKLDPTNPQHAWAFSKESKFADQLKPTTTERIQSREANKSNTPKEIKPKREKDETLGIVKGTKKALTYHHATHGETVEDTIALVLAQFPEADPKSIKIWFKRATKEIGVIAPKEEELKPKKKKSKK